MTRPKLKINKTKISSPLLYTSDYLVNEFTFNEFFNTFQKFYELKVLEGLSPRSLNDYKNHMNYFKKYIDTQQRTTLVRCVEIDVFRSYLYYMVQEKEYKPCTINIRLRTMRAYLKWLYKEGYLSEDLSSRLKLVKEPIDTIIPLSDTDVKKLLKQPNLQTYVGLRDFTIMIIMLDCGIRVGELVNLKINDVELKGRYINIRSEVAKTRVFRQVPISSKTVKYLKEIISIVEDTNSDYLFLSAYGNKLDTNQIINNFRNYGRQCNIKQRCSPHVLRHTFAVNFIKSNGDVFTLQRILGHTTLDMTRRYIQLTSTDIIKKHKEVSPLDRFLK